MADSKIEWTDTTWNPVIGCAKVSAGCKNCYAEKQATRILHLNKFTGPYLDVIRGADEELPSRWNGKAAFLPERLGDPLRWRKPRRVFANSMSDLFHEDINFEQVAAVFGVMAAAPQHTFQVLTKRPGRMVEFFKWASSAENMRMVIDGLTVDGVAPMELQDRGLPSSWPLPNVHLGVSVEDQRAADERIPVLLACPAALRFLSVEPLLGAVDLWPSFAVVDSHGEPSGPRCNADGSPAIGWVIVGGESGPGARACDVAWIRSIVDQCGEAGVPAFVKQLGARPTASSVNDIGDAMFAAIEAADMATAEMLRDGCLCELRLRDRKGGNPDEWPEDLRVRQLPATAVR